MKKIKLVEFRCQDTYADDGRDQVLMVYQEGIRNPSLIRPEEAIPFRDIQYNTKVFHRIRFGSYEEGVRNTEDIFVNGEDVEKALALTNSFVHNIEAPLKQKIERLETRLQATRNKNGELLDRIEEQMKLIAWLKIPWFLRIFKKRPR